MSKTSEEPGLHHRRPDAHGFHSRGHGLHLHSLHILHAIHPFLRFDVIDKGCSECEGLLDNVAEHAQLVFVKWWVPDDLCKLCQWTIYRARRRESTDLADFLFPGNTASVAFAPVTPESEPRVTFIALVGE